MMLRQHALQDRQNRRGGSLPQILADQLPYSNQGREVNVFPSDFPIFLRPYVDETNANI